MVEKRPPAKLVRTSDHKVLRTWPATSCMFARRSSLYACMEPRGDNGEVDIVVYDGTKEIMAMGARINLLDITEVSDDGSRLVIGDHMFQTSRALVDLERASITQLRFDGAPVSFHSDGRLLSFDGTYLELFDAGAWGGE